jgi:hypothetical protein
MGSRGDTHQSLTAAARTMRRSVNNRHAIHGQGMCVAILGLIADQLVNACDTLRLPGA